MLAALVLMLGLAVLPASADCAITDDNGGNDGYTCDNNPAADSDGLNVGSGNDTVNVTTSTTIGYGATPDGSIYSSGGNVWLVVLAGETLNTGDHAVLVDNGGNIVASGTINSDSMGLWVNGDGDITYGVDQSPNPNPDPNSTLTADDIAMWINGSGNAINYGNVDGGTAGMFVGELDDIEDLLDEPTSTGNVTNYGTASGGVTGMGLFGNGTVNNYGLAQGALTGMAGIGDVEMNNYGDAYGSLAGMFGYGSGTMTNANEIQSSGVGMVFISRVDIDEQALEDIMSASDELEFIVGIGDLVNSIEFEGEVEINNDGLIEAPVGVLLVGDGSANNSGIIRNAFLGIGAYGNADINNTGSIYGSLVGAALIGNINIDTEFVADLFTDADPDSMSDLGILFYIAAALNAIEFEGGGTMTNSYNIGYDEFDNEDSVAVGMIQLGNGAVINEEDGWINADYLGMGLYGNGSVINHGDVYSDSGIGLLFIGDISFDDELFFDIDSAAELLADGDLFGPINFGTGTITNTGEVDAGIIGIGAIGNVTINNSGEVHDSYVGIGAIGPNVTINNSGDVYDADLGIIAAGDNVTVNNSGSIDNVSVGVTVYGNGTVNNSGLIEGDDVGISANGDVTVNLRAGSETGGYDAAVVGDAGGQTVNIDGIVYNGNVIAAVVDLQEGRDRVNLGDDADVEGDIDMGEGDDTVQIASGSRVDGTIDGGEGGETAGDLLIVGDEEICGEAEGASERFFGTRELVDEINLDSDTFDFDGENYTIENFERGESGVRQSRCYQFIQDGRINPYDMGAPVAGYCNIQEGLNVWPIDDGDGQIDFSVSGSQMQAALIEAVGTGQNVLIAQGARGASLWALSSNEYQMMRLQSDGKMYVYIFEPGRCGDSGKLPQE